MTIDNVQTDDAGKFTVGATHYMSLMGHILIRVLDQFGQLTDMDILIDLIHVEMGQNIGKNVWLKWV